MLSVIIIVDARRIIMHFFMVRKPRTSEQKNPNNERTLKKKRIHSFHMPWRDQREILRLHYKFSFNHNYFVRQVLSLCVCVSVLTNCFDSTLHFLVCTIRQMNIVWRANDCICRRRHFQYSGNCILIMFYSSLFVCLSIPPPSPSACRRHQKMCIFKAHFLFSFHYFFCSMFFCRTTKAAKWFNFNRQKQQHQKKRACNAFVS